MSRLTNKQIIVAVTGGIAAYKSPDVVRRLREAGADVRVIMTSGALEFITPMTLQAVSGHKVHRGLLDEETEAAMGHIELARWADAIVIAPCTADTMARIANGRADDLLGTVLAASNAPKLLAPAMNQAMWRDNRTQHNLELIQGSGMQLIGPESGSQACGDVGLGRMSEPEHIATAVGELFSLGTLSGCHVLVTAGPTREPIDPVRYISNSSSGKMGFAIAEAAADAGAKVTLIAGPVQQDTPHQVKRINVVTAAEMHEACEQVANDCDVFIACAAVADFRPEKIAYQKIKKDINSSSAPSITLTINPDILAAIAKQFPSLYCVGFAAETQKVLEYAREKRLRKGIAMIVANDVSRSDMGFDANDNEATIITEHSEHFISKCSKPQLARQLISHIGAALHGN